jgi:plasmid replication initiation protein
MNKFDKNTSNLPTESFEQEPVAIDGEFQTVPPGKVKKIEYIPRSSLNISPCCTKNDVIRSNQLCEAKLEMHNNELSNKIFCTLIANIDQENFPNISIDIKLLNEPNDLLGGLYTRIKKSTDLLSRTRITKVFFNKKTGKESGFSFENIFQTLKYDKGQIFGKFHSEMEPLLLNLRKYFTKLKLDTLLKFGSFYSQRLYEILSANRYKGEIVFDLYILQEMLTFPEAMRNDFRKFRVKVLEQAKKEIEKFTDLKYDYFPLKSINKGSKIVAVKFIFTDNIIVKYDTDFLFKEGTDNYKRWKDDWIYFVCYFANILTRFTASKDTIISISTEAAKIGFDVEKYVNYCINIYDIEHRNSRENIKTYIINGLKKKIWPKVDHDTNIISDSTDFINNKNIYDNTKIDNILRIENNSNEDIFYKIISSYNEKLGQKNWAPLVCWTNTLYKQFKQFNLVYKESINIEFWDNYFNLIASNNYLNSNNFYFKNQSFIFKVETYERLLNNGYTIFRKENEEEQNRILTNKIINFIKENHSKQFKDGKGNTWELRQKQSKMSVGDYDYNVYKIESGLPAMNIFELMEEIKRGNISFI